MTNKVPYLPQERIERDASALLAEFAQKRGILIEPPIPIENIIEKHLRLRIEFDDTHRLLGIRRSGLGLNPDILGAIFFDDRRIVIEESLDPDEDPPKEGRYRFTLAHEGGHWRLHRHLFAKNPAQASLYGASAAPSIVCRSSQAEARIEWQANFYVSCLLMPRNLVLAAWHETVLDCKRNVFSRVRRLSIPSPSSRALDLRSAISSPAEAIKTFRTGSLGSWPSASLFLPPRCASV